MTIPLSEAKSIPWHPSHLFGAVDANGDYCRYINEPVIKYGKCWVGDSIYNPQTADVLCKVTAFADWRETLHTRPDVQAPARDALVLICSGDKSDKCGWRGYIDDLADAGRCPHCGSTTNWETQG